MRTLGALLLIALLSGCTQHTIVDSGPAAAPSGSSSGPAAAPSGSSSAPATADEMLIQVRYVGGEAPVRFVMTSVPIISFYGDGRVVTPAPTPAAFPGPALANVQVQHVTSAKLRDMVDQALKAGVGTAVDPDCSDAAEVDAPSTRFLVEGRATVVSLPADYSHNNLTQPQRDVCKKFQDLLDALLAAPGTAATPYVPTGVAAFADPWDGTRNGLPSPTPSLTWPGPALPGDGTDVPGCVVATGDQGATVRASASKADALTPWTWAGKWWWVRLRPLLPGESRCADLKW